jgi:TRAP-type mannitol/chloroaromatic compound transport system permease large subunit
MKIRNELWFGIVFMSLIVGSATYMLLSVETITNGHLGLLMLSLVVTAIMLGFPTAFTLMGMGMLFSWMAYDQNTIQTLDLMVQSAYKTMASDVLIAIPLFVFMGYLVERANLIEKLFSSLHLAMARIPGSLAVATLATCAIFATATGIVGAVVTLMGLLALPQMLRAGYSVPLAAGAITAGGCLGILIPPSVLLIVYGATAGVSVVQLYAGAFFPGLMLTGLYILYIILVAKLKPAWAPPLSAADRLVTLPPLTQKLTTDTSVYAFTRLVGALKGSRNVEVPLGHILRQLSIVVLPGLIFLLIAVSSFKAVTTVDAIPVYDIQPIGSYSEPVTNEDSGGLQSPPLNGDELQVPQSSGVQEPPGAEPSIPSSLAASIASAETAMAEEPEAATTRDAPTWWWVCFAILGALVTLFYLFLSFARLEIFKMLLSSFFPLMVLIISVLGSIVMGLATPTEAAAMGALGGFVLAVVYRRLTLRVLQEAVFLTAKTSAMVCWLFVGSAIFSAAFALLGGQNLVEEWVLSMDLSTTQFLIMSQVVIFLLGWSLEWTEIIVIFMPIFIPLLDNFGVDPLFFGLLVALNLQTAFLSPPVAMAAFYLKGVAPKHVTLNQIFLGMLPFMGIQILAIVMLYQFPGIGMWLPEMLYR